MESEHVSGGGSVRRQRTVIVSWYATVAADGSWLIGIPLPLLNYSGTPNEGEEMVRGICGREVCLLAECLAEVRDAMQRARRNCLQNARTV